MTVSVSLPPDVEKRIQVEAAKRSVAVEDYLLWLISSAVPTMSDTDRRQRAVAAIELLSEMGTEDEQRETFEYLAHAIDQDRLSLEPVGGPSATRHG